MLFSKNPKVEDMVVHTLAATPNLSAKDLHENISRQYQNVSIQAVYQELRKLEKEGTVLRYHKRYSLNLSWVLELASFSDRVYDRYTMPDVLGPLPEAGSATQRWTFHSIASLVPFWAHLVLSTTQQSEQRQCFEYVDHIWFHLTSSTVESKLLKAIQGLGVEHYIAVGGDSYLDRLYKRDVDSEFVKLRYNASVFPEKGENYLTCTGPYIIRIKPRTKHLKEIEDFYNSVSSAKSLHAGAIAEFVNKRRSLTLYLEHNEDKARKIQRSFGRFFGLRKVA